MFAKGLGVHPLDPGRKDRGGLIALRQVRTLRRAQLGAAPGSLPHSCHILCLRAPGGPTLLTGQGMCPSSVAVTAGCREGHRRLRPTRNTVLVSHSHLAGVCCVPAMGDLGAALVWSTGPLHGWCPGNGCVVPGPSLKLLLAQTLLPSIRRLSCMAPANLCAVPTCCRLQCQSPNHMPGQRRSPLPQIKNDLQCLELLWTAALTSPQYTSVLGSKSA